MSDIETGGRSDAPSQQETPDRADIPESSDQIALDESNRQNRESASPPDSPLGGGGGPSVTWRPDNPGLIPYKDLQGAERARAVAEYWEKQLGTAIE